MQQYVHVVNKLFQVDYIAVERLLQLLRVINSATQPNEALFPRLFYYLLKSHRLSKIVEGLIIPIKLILDEIKLKSLENHCLVLLDNVLKIVD